MFPTRLATTITLLRLRLSDRIRHLNRERDRGSETTEKVMWIALLVVLVLAVYAIFQTKIINKITSITL